APGNLPLPVAHSLRVGSLRELIEKRRRCYRPKYGDRIGDAYVTLCLAQGLDLYQNVRSVGRRSNPDIFRTVRNGVDIHDRPDRFLVALSLPKHRIASEGDAFGKHGRWIPPGHPTAFPFGTEEREGLVGTARQIELSGTNCLLGQYRLIHNFS